MEDRTEKLETNFSRGKQSFSRFVRPTFSSIVAGMISSLIVRNQQANYSFHCSESVPISF